MRRLAFLSVLLFSVVVLMSAQSSRPVPHDVRPYDSKTVNLSKGVMLADPKGLFSEDVDFLTIRDKGIALTVDFGAAVAGQAGVRPESGAYVLDVTSKAVTVTGYDEAGAFYGLQTLRALVEDAEDLRKVPCLHVNDWPSVSDRGFADGVYGGSRSLDLRLSMIDIAGRLKMNRYVYTPGNDPYLSGSDWYMPYPQGRADDIRKLMDACRQNRIVFTWCIRPGEDFSWSDSDYALLLGKFEMMHFLGVRSFGILLDGMPEADNGKKRELLERIDADFISKKGLEPLLVSLDGLYVLPEGNRSVLPGLYGRADMTWNSEAYDPMKSLEWAIGETAPDVTGPYMTYAMHSGALCDAFGIEESGSLDFIGVTGFTGESYDMLMEEFRAIEDVPSAMSVMSDRELYAELKPWLEEFGRLGARGKGILECIAFHKEGNIPGFWSAYAANLMSDKELESFMAHPSGTARLHPYYERMMKELPDVFNAEHKGKVTYTHIPGEGIETYVAPDEAAFCHIVLDNPEGREVIIRLSDASGRYTAEFCIDSSYFEFEMKDDAVRVEVIGNVPVFETVFVQQL